MSPPRAITRRKLCLSLPESSAALLDELAEADSTTMTETVTRSLRLMKHVRDHGGRVWVADPKHSGKLIELMLL